MYPVGLVLAESITLMPKVRVISKQALTYSPTIVFGMMVSRKAPLTIAAGWFKNGGYP
jgi:hypothetical protein